MWTYILALLGCGDQPEVLPEPPPPMFSGRPRPVDRHGALRVQGNRIVGEHGRPVQLRGVSTQWLNWEQTYATSRPALHWLRDDWGVDVLRLANGVEHATGYLRNRETRHETVLGIIENALDAGVYVLVDWHTHRIDTRDEAVAFFSEIAERYGHHPHVIYETYNEPGGHDWESELRPYHQAVIAAIRAHDPDNLVVVGTPQYDQRPDAALSAPLDDPNVAYALHFYACSHQQAIRDHGQAVLDAGRPVFVSEWASMGFEGGLVLPWLCPEATVAWLDWMEEHQVSGAAWKLSTDYDLASMLKPTAPVAGGWSDRHLSRHGRLVRDWVRAGVR